MITRVIHDADPDDFRVTDVVRRLLADPDCDTVVIHKRSAFRLPDGRELLVDSTGKLVRTGELRAAFVTAAVVALAGFLMWVFYRATAGWPVLAWRS